MLYTQRKSGRENLICPEYVYKTPEFHCIRFCAQTKIAHNRSGIKTPPTNAYTNYITHIYTYKYRTGGIYIHSMSLNANIKKHDCYIEPALFK